MVGEEAAAAEYRRQERKVLQRVLILTLPVTLALVLFLPGISPIFRLFSMPATSMAPTIPVGSLILVSRVSYGYSRYSFDAFELPLTGRWPAGRPSLGDIIVLRLPRPPKITYVKRVIGLPGDRIEIRAGAIVRNGTIVERRPIGAGLAEEWLAAGVHYRIRTSSSPMPSDVRPELTVPAGHVYVLGDNRPNSHDSRFANSFGFIPIDHIVGRVIWSSGG